ncbi:MAG: bifunctional serine/threonine-protein kinase/formylglycine-generating enzyme family protein [Polyangiaceae bacterium]|nr:bifunctional serine/threonine-protein kinase/formylglycine-generating enzyme family protein [Polyangiaceae bacterium]
MTEPTPGGQLTPWLRLSRYLARGSMGSLWLAHHEGLGAEVVVKFLCEASNSRIDLARFEREATVLASVHSPHVVRYLEHGVSSEGLPFLVLERLEGYDLSVALRRYGPLAPAHVALVIGQVAQALSAIHRLGIVHRDVKPSNIFLCGGYQAPLFAKLLDFGIAKNLLANEPLTSTGQLVGTPNFMSPEQLKAKTIDHRADLWALGVVTYRALTGQLPFAGESFIEVVTQVVSGRITPPSSLRPDLPPSVDRWVERACALEAVARFGSAEEMAHALYEALQGHAPAPAPAPMGVAPESALFSNTSTTLGASAVSAAAKAAFVSPATPSQRERPGLALRTAPWALALTACAALGLGWAMRRAPAPSTNTVAQSTMPERPLGDATLPAPKTIAANVARSTLEPSARGACPTGMVALGGPNPSVSALATPSAYCLDVHEVAADEYRECVRAGVCGQALPRASSADAAPHQALEGLCTANLPGRDRHPINCVDWASADAYCRRAGKRLPTPDEWEFAIRGGTGRTFPWGEELPNANHLNGCGSECKRWGLRHHVTLDALHSADDGFYGTAPVGTFPRGRSVEGVDDLLGNVMEWADESAGSSPHQPGGPGSPVSTPRLVMGSGWNVSSVAALRTPPRATLPGSTRSHLVGFRCAASSPQP